jgi:hypothetical protein
MALDRGSGLHGAWCINSQQKIIDLCLNDFEMSELGSNAEMVVRHYHPELEPGTEEFYAEVLREMGQSERPRVDGKPRHRGVGPAK